MRLLRSACSPVIGSLVSRKYLDFAMPHSSGQIIAAWSPAVTPMRTWPSNSLACLAAIGTSHSSASARPAPTAEPLIADTIGFLQSISALTRPAPPRKSLKN
ncbi:conserved hypothetical protein [Ricinus communis]|uniref:Uncharacterized protein n=1 Tax=Ricinus communis TaxID=3988 RepID=B9TD29_RICCO|nr:conserved hypothetical protein [Ricinus communis]